MAHQTARHISPELQRCIDECLPYYATFEATTTHCLQIGGCHVDPAHIKVLADLRFRVERPKLLAHNIRRRSQVVRQRSANDLTGFPSESF
jgi:hypothetical protein